MRTLIITASFFLFAYVYAQNPVPWRVDNAENKPAQTAQDINAAATVYQSFLKQMGGQELGAGMCVGNAVSLAGKFKSSPLIDYDKTRLILMTLEPADGYMPSALMFPDSRYLRGAAGSQAASGWIWHAFILYKGVVFDPNYSDSPENAENYFKKFWQSYQLLDSVWVFSTNPDRIDDIAGRENGQYGRPKMLNWRPVSYRTIVEDPMFLSVRKQFR